MVQKTEHLYDTENRITTQGWQFRNSDGTYTTTTETYAYNTDGSVYTVTPSSGGTYAFEYDALKRQSGRYNWYYKSNYSYADGKNEGETTTQVSEIFYEHRPGGTSFDEFTIKYTYDALGNITAIECDEWPELEATYEYDTQGQLVYEHNKNGEFDYTYDTYGNIRSAVKRNSSSSTAFTYDNEEWRDLLTAYKGHAISYDAIGNPLNWKNNTTWTSLTWQNGRQLTAIASSSKSLSFTYDLAGIRDSKTVVASGVTTAYNFVTQNGQVVRQTWTDGTTSHVMDFIYDNQGRPYAADYDGTRYYYVLSLQGDVLRMVDTTGATVASYVYDAWGRILTSSGTLKDVNPLRYRGYYYDAETKLYYLQSRYYDPLVKRFVNADVLLSTGQGLLGHNVFAYCNNSPVAHKDSSGNALETVFDLISLGASIAEVAVNPADPWAWIGLIGDAADVAIPCVGGLGEAVRALRAVDAIDDSLDLVKMTQNTLGVISSAAKAASLGGPNSVYVSYRSDNRLLEYVGITNDFKRRSDEWEGTRKIFERASGLDRKTARYAEQTIITLFGKKGNTLSNRINSIGKKGSKYGDYVKFFAKLF